MGTGRTGGNLSGSAEPGAGMPPWNGSSGAGSSGGASVRALAESGGGTLADSTSGRSGATGRVPVPRSSGAAVMQRIYGVPVATFSAEPSTSLPEDPDSVVVGISSEEEDEQTRVSGSAGFEGSADFAGLADEQMVPLEDVLAACMDPQLRHNIFQVSWSNADGYPMWLGQCMRCRAWVSGSAGMIRHLESTPPGGDKIPAHAERLVAFFPDREFKAEEFGDPCEYLVSCHTCRNGVIDAEELDEHFERSHSDWKDDYRRMILEARGSASMVPPGPDGTGGTGQRRWHLVNLCSHGRHRSEATAYNAPVRNVRTRLSQAPVAAEPSEHVCMLAEEVD